MERSVTAPTEGQETEDVDALIDNFAVAVLRVGVKVADGLVPSEEEERARWVTREALRSRLSTGRPDGERIEGFVTLPRHRFDDYSFNNRRKYPGQVPATLIIGPQEKEQGG